MATGDLAIGIDLGTTYSCAGIWRQGKVEIVPNEQGNRITPSCVAFTATERLIGEGAMNEAIKNPTNTVYDAKRLIGRRFSDEVVKNDMKIWPFRVVGERDMPKIVVEYKGNQLSFTPEEISSMILSNLKAITEKYVGYEVKKAVVTVPAYFNNSQRQATKNAGTIAGLHVMHILNEPTAAALAYGFQNTSSSTIDNMMKRNVLVFDLGGGTLDVSIVQVDPHGAHEVKATAGDTHLGGQDFNQRMVTYLVQHIRDRYNHNLSQNPRAIARLQEKCERAKRALSSANVTHIVVDCLFGERDFDLRFSRAKFEEINKDLFIKCFEPLKQCLEDARIMKADIDEVLLVGGSTRIPKIQEMLTNFFEGKHLNNRINADEAVAYGATLRAALLCGQRPDVSLSDITPLSLGLEDAQGFMNVVIPRNNRVPCMFTQDNWHTASDFQTSVAFNIYEGERPMAAHNNLLGKFELTGLRSAPMGEVKFIVIFKIDEDGILNVSAWTRDGNDNAEITITGEDLALSKHEVERMMADAREFQLDDMVTKKTIIARQELEKYLSSIMNFASQSNAASRLRNTSWNRLAEAIDRLTIWMEQNENSPYYELEYQKVCLRRVWEPTRLELERTGLNTSLFEFVTR